MSDIIDLTKKVEVVLDLRKIPQVKAQVCLCIDGSGSMQSLYKYGVVQKTVDRISAIAVKFDDNQELDVKVFSDDCNEAKAATPEMFGSYVNNELLGKRLVPFGGTNYSPFINDVVSSYFSKNESVGKSVLGALKNLFGGKSDQKTSTSSKSDSGFPIFCIVITDGQNGDGLETTRLLEQMKDKDIYWQFVGIGSERFDYVSHLADSLPNVGFFAINDLDCVKDMELYKNLLSEEFANFIKKF